MAFIDTDIKAVNSDKKETKGTELSEIKEKIESREEEILKESPAVRRIAEENNISPKEVKGTGKDGRITKGDILNKLNEKTGNKRDEKSDDKRETVVKMSPIRNTIAKKLVQAKQEAAHLTTFNEINMEHVINIRNKHKDEFLKNHGIKLGFMSFFVKASCQALKEFPDVNTMVRENEIVYFHYYNIGVAIAVEEGLIVPVIKDADMMHFSEIELKINELAQKAKEKKIKIDELQGGTFTITNGGIFGSMLSTPIPSYPQTAILGMHAINERAYVVDGKIEIKPIMYVCPDL